MSYTIHKSDGTTLVSVPENDIVLNAASVALVGRGATNYGAVHSEAFVHIMENFANATPPAYPLQGQLWFDTNLGVMKVYKSGVWEIIGASGAGQGVGDSAGGGIYVPINFAGVITSVFANVAGGEVVSATANQDIPVIALPTTITIQNTSIPFAARFPNGLQGGTTLATDIRDYLFMGHSPAADQAIFTGGGSPFAATTFCDLGATCVSLSISNNQIVSVFSQTPVSQANLPVNFTVNGVTMPFRASFSFGLHAGLTMADGLEVGIGAATLSASASGVTLSTVNQLITNEATARASADTTLKAYTDSTFATAASYTNLVSTFETHTGQSSLASAIDWLVTTASAGSAGADYTVALKTQITNAITGSTDFANALTNLNTAVTNSAANATAITDIQSKFINGTGTSFATAVSTLLTNASAGAAASSAVTSLSSQLISTTGQTTTATAISSLWTAANRSAAGWSISLNSGGNVAGLTLLSGSDTKSSFTVQAEKFLIAPQTGSAIIPFRVENNVVYMDTAIIQDLTVGSRKINPNAITNFNYAEITGSVVAVPKYGTVQVLSLTINKEALDSTLKITVFLTVDSPDDEQVVVYVYMDGSLIKSSNQVIISDGYQQTINTITIPVYLAANTVPQGSHTFSVSVYNYEANYSQITIDNGSIEVMEIKK